MRNERMSKMRSHTSLVPKKQIIKMTHTTLTAVLSTAKKGSPVLLDVLEKWLKYLRSFLPYVMIFCALYLLLCSHTVAIINAVIVLIFYFQKTMKSKKKPYLSTADRLIPTSSCNVACVERQLFCVFVTTTTKALLDPECWKNPIHVITMSFFTINFKKQSPTCTSVRPHHHSILLYDAFQ
jgi:hypothetical protein